MLQQVGLQANKVFQAGFEEHKLHWHGWRHATPCNMLELEPKPTTLEVCLWCRMIESTLRIYLASVATRATGPIRSLAANR